MHHDSAPNDPQSAQPPQPGSLPGEQSAINSGGRRKRPPFVARKANRSDAAPSDEGGCRIFQLPRTAPKPPPGVTPGDVIAEQVALLADLDTRYDDVLRELSELDDRIRATLLQFQKPQPTAPGAGDNAPAPPHFSRDRGVA